MKKITKKVAVRNAKQASKAKIAAKIAKVATPKAPIEKMPDISDKVIALKWSRSRFSNRRKVQNTGGIITTDADKARLTLHKRLLESEAFGRIVTLDAYIGDYLCATALPSRVFAKAGVYLVPIELVDAVNDKLAAFKAQREQLVREFIKGYEEDIQASAAALGELFIRKEYPDPGSMAASFSCGWQFFDLNAPRRLESINPAIFREQRDKAAESFEKMAFEIRDVLRVGWAELVKGMIDRLSPAADGKRRKGFHESFQKKFTEFLDIFDVRNVTNDKELKALVAKARELVKGVDIDNFRDDESFRNTLLKEFTDIGDAVKPWVVEKADRMITFDEDAA